jgi:glyoxylate/hydroxypyruvate reductase
MPPRTPICRMLTDRQRSLRSIKRVDLNELARDSDVVFVLTPGGTDTRHLINEEFLRQMQKTSSLVNTSRGSVVDSDALARALREGWIWGAGVDVIEGEPQITADHPLVKEPKYDPSEIRLDDDMLTLPKMRYFTSHWKCHP